MARPTGYDPEYHPKELLKLMASGAKDCIVWAALEISKDTYYRWLRQFPEFKEMHEKGLPLCERMWELKGEELMAKGDNKAFNYWIAFMNRKFGWATRGGSEGNTQINNINVNVLSDKSNAELIEFIKDKLQDAQIIGEEKVVEELEYTPFDDYQEQQSIDDEPRE